MLPVLYRFTFQTLGEQIFFIPLALLIIGYFAWSGWKKTDRVDKDGKQRAATDKEKKDKAIQEGLIGALVAGGAFLFGKNRGIPIHTYGIMLGAGFLSAVTVASLLARREWPGELGLKRRDQIMELAFSVFVGGIVGSMDLFVLVNWKKLSAEKPAQTFSTVLDLVVVAALVAMILFRNRFGPEFAQRVVQNAGSWFVKVAIGGRVVFFLLMNRSNSAGSGDGMKTLESLVETVTSGLVFQGGLIGATLASVWFCMREDISFLRIADIAAPTVSLGAAFGRLGCFSAGCCWGKPVGPAALFHVQFPGSHSTKTLIGTHSDTASLAWSSMSTDARYVIEKTGEIFEQAVPDAVNIGSWVRDHDHTLAIHPVQLYDSLAQLSFFLLMLTVRRWRRFHGMVFGLWLMGYSIIRSSVELLRGDTERGTIHGWLLERGMKDLAELFPAQAWYNISTGQTVSILMFALGTYIVVNGFRARAAQPKVDLNALTAAS